MENNPAGVRIAKKSLTSQQTLHKLLLNVSVFQRLCFLDLWSSVRVQQMSRCSEDDFSWQNYWSALWDLLKFAGITVVPLPAGRAGPVAVVDKKYETVEVLYRRHRSCNFPFRLYLSPHNNWTHCAKNQQNPSSRPGCEQSSLVGHHKTAKTAAEQISSCRWTLFCCFWTEFKGSDHYLFQNFKPILYFSCYWSFPCYR